MKTIQLSSGETAIIDDDDFDLVSHHKWFYTKDGYAIAFVNHKSLLMHRLILGFTTNDGMISDHINHNRLDNRKCNLRSCTRSQNVRNISARKDCTSKYLGVNWNPVIGKWTSYCNKQFVGSFDDEIEAARAYDSVALYEYGEFANPNFPNPSPTSASDLKAERKSHRANYVRKSTYNDKWIATAYVNKKLIHLGTFLTQQEAAAARESYLSSSQQVSRAINSN